MGAAHRGPGGLGGAVGFFEKAQPPGIAGGLGGE